jgi:hypothetical protein
MSTLARELPSCPNVAAVTFAMIDASVETAFKGALREVTG